MLKGASRVQIPPSPCQRAQVQTGVRLKPDPARLGLRAWLPGVASSCSGRARVGSTSSARCGGCDPDVEIVVVERELAGGECSYYACIPTKTLLRARRSARGRAAGARRGGGRDRRARRRAGVLVARRGHDAARRRLARRTGWRSRVRSSSAAMRASRARASSRSATGRSSTQTSSSPRARRPAVPPVDGSRRRADFWTNQDAVWAEASPESLVVLGGGPGGRRAGAVLPPHGLEGHAGRVLAHVLARIDAEAAELLRSGFETRASTSLRRRAPSASRRRAAACASRPRSGEAIEAERLLLAVGRAPTSRARARAARRRDFRRRESRSTTGCSAGGRRVGDRRPDRSRAAHARREVPGACRSGERGRRRLPGGLPRDPGGGVHRPAGRVGRHDGAATTS